MHTQDKNIVGVRRLATQHRRSHTGEWAGHKREEGRRRELLKIEHVCNKESECWIGLGMKSEVDKPGRWDVLQPAGRMKGRTKGATGQPKECASYGDC